jgi:hypothetical protein
VSPESILAKAESMLIGKLKEPECLRRIRALQLRHEADTKVLEAFCAEVAQNPDLFIEPGYTTTGPVVSSAPARPGNAMLSIPESGLLADRVSMRRFEMLGSSAPSSSHRDAAMLSDPSRTLMSSRHRTRSRDSRPKKKKKQKRGILGFIKRLFMRWRLLKRPVENAPGCR